MNNDQVLEELKNRLKTVITKSYSDFKPELEKDLKEKNNNILTQK